MSKHGSRWARHCCRMIIVGPSVRQRRKVLRFVSADPRPPLADRLFVSVNHLPFEHVRHIQRLRSRDASPVPRRADGCRHSPCACRPPSRHHTDLGPQATKLCLSPTISAPSTAISIWNSVGLIVYRTRNACPLPFPAEARGIISTPGNRMYPVYHRPWPLSRLFLPVARSKGFGTRDL